MELKSILLGLNGIKAKGNLGIDINNIQNVSENVSEGDMFVAIKGYEKNGNDYIEEAIKRGAKVIMAQDDIDKNIIKQIPENVTIILVPDTRHALAIAACNYYNNPSRKFKLIGVTGTKGKTTTTYMIKNILEKNGTKVGLIGTIANYIGSTKLPETARTTPESLELQKIFYKMAEEKCEVVVMEVSSQSLKLSRVDGCDFDIGLFTNISEDHISEKEHECIEEYFATKIQLFKMCKLGYINSDDVYVSKIPKLIQGCEFKTFGIDNPSNLLAKDITVTNTSVDFKVKLGEKNERVKVGIPGRFSVYNALAAISVCLNLGANSETIKEALLNIKVPGRSELVENDKDLTIMLDYAHTPESLENILTTVKAYTKGKVICVFGCGGDRDKNKRKIMGEISGRLADYTIITSDNPRTEKPEIIIDEIEEGIKKIKANYECIVDRKEAIKKAIEMARRNDMVLIAGKGHELTQEINGEEFPFDERKIVKDILENR